MPELPEVETVRCGLEPVLCGARFLRVEQRRPGLRFAFPARFTDRLQNQSVLFLRRRAKYLLAHLTDGEVLVMHLGMSGRFKIIRPGITQQPGDFQSDLAINPAHDHVIFHMSNGTEVRYNDARRFGFMLLVDEEGVATHKLFRSLGPEPLGNELTPDFLAAKARGRKTSLKALLMDQRTIAGLGNIYVCEILYHAGLSPRRLAGTLVLQSGAPGARAQRLVPAVRAVLQEAIGAGGSTLRDHRQTDGSLGYFQHRFKVYGREGKSCVKSGCKARIKRIVQNGRSTFFCPRCQK